MASFRRRPISMALVSRILKGLLFKCINFSRDNKRRAFGDQSIHAGYSSFFVTLFTQNVDGLTKVLLFLRSGFQLLFLGLVDIEEVVNLRLLNQFVLNHDQRKGQRQQSDNRQPDDMPGNRPAGLPQNLGADCFHGVIERGEPR